VTNLLLVEDDEVDVMNVKRALRSADARIWTASTAAGGLAMLRSDEVPHERLLILLDLNLPMMSGLDFLQALRSDEHLSGVPVIVLTTSDAPQDRAGAYRWNVAGYLVKPLAYADFAAALDRVLSYWEIMEMC
jgi:CheY-like chemotaxis protein